MFAEARYLTNQEGKRIGVVVDPEEFEFILKVYRHLTEISESLRKSVSELEKSAGRDSTATDLENHNIGHLEEKLAEVGEWLEELEDLQAGRVYYEAMDEIERGDDKPTLLKETIPRIEREREELRRRGEL